MKDRYDRPYVLRNLVTEEDVRRVPVIAETRTVLIVREDDRRCGVYRRLGEGRCVSVPTGDLLGWKAAFFALLRETRQGPNHMARAHEEGPQGMEPLFDLEECVETLA